MRRRGALIAIAMAAAALMALPGTAFGFELANVSATPASQQAGANSDVVISLDIADPDPDLRDLTIHLPPGLVGNPLAAPQCTEEQLNDLACPPESDVGDVSNDVILSVLGLLPVNQTVSGNLYNMAPQPGEPARFGIILSPLPVALPGPLADLALPPIVLQSPVKLRPGDLGLDSILTDLPREANLLALGPVPPVTAGITITGIDLTLSGQAGSPPQGFIRLPTSCKEHVVGVDAVAYDDTQASGQATFTTTGCENVPFSPELTASVRPQGQGLPADFSTTITQTIEEAGLARAEVTLPQGVLGDIAVLANRCARDVFFSATCPDGTTVGDAVATSPLQSQPLSGPVFSLASTPPALGGLGVDLKGPLALKLTADVSLASGRAINTFAGLPDIPISDFTLSFPAERRLIITDDLCKNSGPLLADAYFLAHSGAEVRTSVPVEVRGCGGGGGGGGGGAGGGADKPRAKVKLRGEQGAAPRIKFRARAGAEKLTRARLRLPKQLSLADGARAKRATRAKADGDRLKGKRVKTGKRSLRLKPNRGARKLSARLGRGAVKVRGELPKRPKFKVALTDATGEKTRITVRAK